MKRLCIFCKSSDHWSDQCEKFPTITERKSILKDNCYQCLQVKNSDHKCKVKRTCVHCKNDTHHRSLCPAKFKECPSVSSIVPEPSLLASGQKVIMQTARAQLRGNDQTIMTRAMFDGGSQRTYITENLADRLGLQRKSPKVLSVLTFGCDKPMNIRTSTVEATLVLKDNSILPLTLDVVPQITGKVTRTSTKDLDKNELKEKWPAIMCGLADTFPEEDDEAVASIEVLIGNDFYWQIVTGEKIEISTGLYFINSLLGWIVTGRTSSERGEQKVENIDESAMLLLTAKELPEMVFKSKLISKENENLEMEHFWNLETIGIYDNIEENDDDMAIEIFNDNIKYEGERYYVTWPWKYKSPPLSDNLQLAKSRLNICK